MKTDGAFRRFAGPLQRHVYFILTLPIFFTAFTFFVDVFTLYITPCSDNTASKSLNQTVDTNIFNISTSWTGNHSDRTRVSNKDCTTYLFRAQHMYSVSYTLICFAAESHVSRGESFCSRASDVHDGLTDRLFIRGRCF